MEPLTALAVQFPIVVIVIYVVFRADKRLTEKEKRLEERADANTKAALTREDQLRKEAREDRDSEVARTIESQKAVVASKDEQIVRLTEEATLLRKELLALVKRPKS